MRIIFLIIFHILLIQPILADAILTGGVDYNINSAREELLKNNKSIINQNLINSKIYDKQNKENRIYLLKGQTDLKDRTLASFSDSTYGVIHFNDKYHVYYYNQDGSLLYIEEKDKLDYPYKSYKYDITGRLVNMSLRVSNGETYIYTPKGSLIAHWIGQNGYNEKGNIVMTRKYSE